MDKNNQFIANKLFEYADLLEALGDNPYKIRAYRRAARVIQKLGDSIYDLQEAQFDLTQLPQIGQGIASIIRHIIETGSVPVIKAREKKSINELLEIKGLGAKRIKLLNEQHHIFTKTGLLDAIRNHQLDSLGEKLINKIKEQIKQPRRKTSFLRLYHALNLIENLLADIKNIQGVTFVACCGDYRRKREIIEGLVFIIQCEDPINLFDHISHIPYIKDLLYQEEKLLRVRLVTGTDMELYCVEKNALASSLIAHTGSQKHKKQLIRYAHTKGFLLNDQGLFKDQQEISCAEESDIYRNLELQYIPPELREGRGEIQAAAVNRLPKLITLEDIKGDLHSHTNESDGQEPLEVMVQAAVERGLEYIAITDHSQSLTITNGLDEKRLLEQIKQIDKLNARLNNIIVLKSIEVDILEDGSLDICNDVLKELDIVVCSVHSKFRLSEQQQTERILRAMDNPYFNILGHATGRLIKSRPPYAIDIDRIFRHAKEHNCFIELNSQPYRLDINDVYCKKAKELGVKVAISTDAHTPRGFSFMQLGIFQARRGWLEKEDVINTRSWPELKKLLQKN